MIQGDDDTPPAGEGAALALNMVDGRDRRRLARGVAAGWGVDDDQLGRYRRALDMALGLAIQSKNARAITSCVRTMATLVSQVQHDEDRQAGVTGQVVVTVQWSD